jgi:quercetin dioxygenase-like cupin family protein
VGPGAVRPVVVRYDRRRRRWQGVASIPYKTAAAGSLAWRGVRRFVLLGAAGEPTAFHVRYFEIAPRGFSSLERHRHAHAVLVVRGRGRVRIGDAEYRLGPLDFVYVPPDAPHQFLADREPFGFVCPVDARRDRPRPVAAAPAGPRSAGGDRANRGRGDWIARRNRTDATR